jgi:hypothetical protein
MSKIESANTATDAPTQQPAVDALLERVVGRLEPGRADMAPRLTTDQRARLISSGPNAGRVRPPGCYECAWGKVAGCWRCGSRA